MGSHLIFLTSDEKKTQQLVFLLEKPHLIMAETVNMGSLELMSQSEKALHEKFMREALAMVSDLFCFMWCQ